MNYITAINNYVVVQPSGDIVGFKELSDARGYISCYYLDNILDYRPRTDDYGSLFDVYQEKDQQDLNWISGVDEGECRIYDLDSLINKIREADYFQDEKDELISRLLEEKIDLNIYDYRIDDLIVDAKQEWSV